MKTMKSSWKEFIAAVENASKIVMCGLVIDLKKVNWEKANKKVDEINANRTLHKVRPTIIEFKNEKDDITSLQRRGKIVKIFTDETNKIYFQINGYLLYYVEIEK